jgi:protein SCO1
MPAQSRLVPGLIWALLGLVVFSVAGVFVSTQIRPAAKPLPVYADVPDFKLTNQLGRVVTRHDLKGNVWVADIIFTRCPGPCAQMTSTLKKVQDGLPESAPVKFVSLTADPAYDTPAVLQQYAERFKAQPHRWEFLTGPKQEIYDLATKGLKLAVEENTEGKPSGELFIHSTRLVLIDRLGQIRSLEFDGTESGAASEIIAAVKQLLDEGAR